MDERVGRGGEMDGHESNPRLAHAPIHLICDVECPNSPEHQGANRKRHSPPDSG